MRKCRSNDAHANKRFVRQPDVVSTYDLILQSIKDQWIVGVRLCESNIIGIKIELMIKV